MTEPTAEAPGAERRYEPVIGLEIHVQLATRTKMFCGCALSFGEQPNTRTCPVCLGHPGTLPVPNAEAIHYALMIALALGCEVAPRSIFHRKNYFYPDLPKGYQISQYDTPLARDGRLGEVRVHRVHLEEDAAKLVHEGSSGRIHGSSGSVVDFNRGGTPLVEIVTEPDLGAASDAAEWLRLLRATLRRIGVSDVNMDEGSLRCDANVSLRPAGDATLGTKTELKNMNSFRFLERGVEAEIVRQEGILGGGGTVAQETLHFDPVGGGLSSLRSKEEVHDYRYFPEPDLVPLAPDEQMLARAREALPELPAERAERFSTELGLAPDTARLLAFRGGLGDFFEAALAAADGGRDAQGHADAEGHAAAQGSLDAQSHADAQGHAATIGGAGVDPRSLANWVTVELVPCLEGEDPAASKVEPAALAELVGMVTDGAVSQSAAKEVLAAMAEEGGRPGAIVGERGLGRAGAGELEQIVERAIAQNADAVARIRAGNDKAIGAIVGAVMRETQGRADGGEVQSMVRERLGAGPPSAERPG